MPELLGKGREAKEGTVGRELIPSGIDRIATPFGDVTIIRGKTPDGEDIAIVRGVDQEPLELLLGDDNLGREGGALTRFKNNPLVRAIGGVAMAASGAMALAACNTDLGGSGSNHNGPSFGVQSSALTVDQLGNIQGQQMPWSEAGDVPGNFAKMNGKNYILFGNSNDNADWNNVSYVECDKLADCLSASAQKSHVEGLDTAGLGGSFYGATIYQDQNGAYKFLVKPQMDGVYEGDIGLNPNTGKLAVTNMQFENPPMGNAVSLVYENGVPHAVFLGSPLYDRNLFDKTQKTISLTNECAAPTQDGNLAILSHSQQQVNGTWDCQLVYADSIDNLATKAASIVTLNNGVASKQLSDPHLATDTDGSGILIYSVAKQTPGYGQPMTFIYYALIPKPATPADTDATGDTTVDTDAGSTVDQDAAVTPDQDATADQEVTIPTDDVASQVDAVIEIDAADIEEITLDITAQDVPPELPPVDVGPDTDSNGSTDAADAQITPDTSKPDTTPDTTEVTPTLTGFEVTVGDCKLEPTPITQGGKDGFSVDINGSGANDALCKFTGVSNGKPVEITLSNDASGDIQITCITFDGSELNCELGLDTTAELLEDKAGAKIKANGITLGSAASHFFTTSRPNGFVDIKNAKGEPIVTVDGPNFTFTVPGDGVVYRIDSKTGGMEEKFPDFPNADAGTSIDIQPQHFDASGSDASVSTPPPGKGGGCEAGPGSVNSSAAMLAAVAGAAILFFRRKRETVKKAA